MSKLLEVTGKLTYTKENIMTTGTTTDTNSIWVNSYLDYNKDIVGNSGSWADTGLVSIAKSEDNNDHWVSNYLAYNNSVAKEHTSFVSYGEVVA